MKMHVEGLLSMFSSATRLSCVFIEEEATPDPICRSQQQGFRRCFRTPHRIISDSFNTILPKQLGSLQIRYCSPQ